MYTKLYHLVFFICCSFLLLAFPAFSQPGGSALSFDGVNDYVQVPDDPSLDMTDGFTIAAWVYLEEYTEWASIVTKGGSDNGSGDLGPNNYTIHQTADGRFRFTSSASTLPSPNPESTTAIALHKWHHVALTFDGSMLRFYLDGNPDGEHAMAGPLPANDDPLNIGADFPGGDEYWHGMIDEVKIWNQALSQTLIIAATFGHGMPQASALAGFWWFDEGSGTVAGDITPESNNGQLINGPMWVSPGAPLGGTGKASSQLEKPIAEDMALISNYPNPFNPSTTITYTLSHDTHVRLVVWNMLGQAVAELVNQKQSAGTHRVVFDARNLPSGIYAYRLHTDFFSTQKRVLLLK